MSESITTSTIDAAAKVEIAATAQPIATSTPAPSASTSASTSASISASTSTPPIDPPHPFRPEEWDLAIGHWTFEEDGSVLCECKATSSLIYRKGAHPKDFDASFEVMFLSDESSAGLIFREQGEDFYETATFYQYEWYTRGSHHDRRLSLMFKNPWWIQIVEPKLPIAPHDVWKKMRVRAEGDHLETFLDDELIFDKHDPTFRRQGRIGIHVFQPRKVRFRNFTLIDLESATDAGSQPR